MVGAGVESVRAAVRWYELQPYGSAAEVPPADAARFRDAGGVPTDFTALDAVVAAAAARGLAVLPVVQCAPAWAARTPGRHHRRRRADPATFGRFLAALAGRYGPRGSLWAERPDLPRVPVRAWQVWNEPNLTRYWSEQPFAPSYVRLLKAADAALAAADPGATVVLAGLPNESWTALRQIYEAGGRGHFDAVALHPYTRRPKDVLRLVRSRAREMRQRGDGRTPVWLTELSWPAAKGKVPRPAGFETTDRGPGGRGSAPRCACSCATAGRCGSSASSGTRGCRARSGRARSTGPACAACAAAPRSPRRRSRSSARPRAGCRDAARRPTRAAAPKRDCPFGGDSPSSRFARTISSTAVAVAFHVKRSARARPAARRRARSAGSASRASSASRTASPVGRRRGARRRRRSPAARGVRRDHGRAGRHRLQHGQAEALVARRAARTPPRRRRARAAARRATRRAGAARRARPRPRTAAGARPRRRPRCRRRPARGRPARAPPGSCAPCATRRRARTGARGRARRAPRSASAAGENAPSTPPGTTLTRSGASPSSSTARARENSETVITWRARRAIAGRSRRWTAA